MPIFEGSSSRLMCLSSLAMRFCFKKVQFWVTICFFSQLCLNLDACLVAAQIAVHLHKTAQHSWRIGAKQAWHYSVSLKAVLGGWRLNAWRVAEPITSHSGWAVLHWIHTSHRVPNGHPEWDPVLWAMALGTWFVSHILHVALVKKAQWHGRRARIARVCM